MIAAVSLWLLGVGYVTLGASLIGLLVLYWIRWADRT